jgi:hypothetical protein
MKNFLIFFCAAFILVSCKNDQPREADPVRRKSPIAIASITHKPTDTYVKIVYGQPYKNGRMIFGDLIPYGEVWRTGANEATEMTTTKPILFNGNRIDAGTYGLFSIPRKNRWTIILNDSLGQWGAFDYNQSRDLLRTDVKAEKNKQMTEKFALNFSEMQGNAASIVLLWDSTRTTIPIEFIGD